MILGLESRVNATIDRRAVDDDGAEPAFCLVAADLGAGQPQFIAQHIRKVTLLGYLDFDGGAVEPHAQKAHRTAPARSTARPRIIGRYIRIIFSR